MERLMKIKDVDLLLSDEPRFRKETLETWALQIITACADQCVLDGNPMVAKQKIMELFREI